MKILLVTFSDNADHQDTTFGLYEKLSENEDVRLLCINNPKVEISKDDNTWLVNCPKRPGISKETFNVKLLFSIIKKIKRENFDVIYFESLHTWNLPVLALFKNKAKTYQVIHEVIPHEGDSQEKMVHFMNKVLCKLSNYIVLHNKSYIDELHRRYNVSMNRIKYLELWRRFPEYTEPKYTKKVLFFGRINPYKGIDNLLKIVQLCPNIQFNVVGRVDSQVQHIVDELKRLPNINLNTSYVTDKEMKNYFIESDWVILPYNSASQSGVIIDAYKYSRPVISFNVGAIVEQIEDGYSGYLIKKGDIEAFVKKIQEVINFSNEEYEKISKKAYHYGLKKYSANYVANRFLKMIDFFS